MCVCVTYTQSFREPWEAQSAQFHVSSHDGPAPGRGFLSDGGLGCSESPTVARAEGRMNGGSCGHFSSMIHRPHSHPHPEGLVGNPRLAPPSEGCWVSWNRAGAQGSPPPAAWAGSPREAGTGTLPEEVVSSSVSGRECLAGLSAHQPFRVRALCSLQGDRCPLRGQRGWSREGEKGVGLVRSALRCVGRRSQAGGGGGAGSAVKSRVGLQTLSSSRRGSPGAQGARLTAFPWLLSTSQQSSLGPHD